MYHEHENPILKFSGELLVQNHLDPHPDPSADPNPVRIRLDRGLPSPSALIRIVATSIHINYMYLFYFIIAQEYAKNMSGTKGLLEKGSLK